MAPLTSFQALPPFTTASKLTYPQIRDQDGRNPNFRQEGPLHICQTTHPDPGEHDERRHSDNSYKDFIVNITTKENFFVRASEWNQTVKKVVDALAKLPIIESLTVSITWQTYIHSVGEIAPPTIPPAVVAMITNNFGRLRGIAHANVSGLGAGPGEALVARMMSQPATRSKKRKAETVEADEAGAGGSDGAPAPRYNLRPRLRR